MRPPRPAFMFRRPVSFVRFSATFAVLLALLFAPLRALAGDLETTVEKANQYIELAKSTERAVESWERYQSWVNMKKGPTGKERYISYGMYDLSDYSDQFKEARATAAKEPRVRALDEAMTRYMDAYDALAPVVNQAAAYYDRQGYAEDNAAEGQALHAKMVPLATAFLAERDAMMPQLRHFVRHVEEQWVADIEKREGRTAVWHVSRVMHAANRVIDLFPRNRPVPMDEETLDEKMKSLGPDTSGEVFDQIIAGATVPPDVSIDVARYREALTSYAKAVSEFSAFKGEAPEDFDEFKPLPGKLLDLLRAFEKPLIESKGRQFDDTARLGPQIVEAFFAMLNASSPIAGSPIRYLP